MIKIKRVERATRKKKRRLLLKTKKGVKEVEEVKREVSAIE